MYLVQDHWRQKQFFYQANQFCSALCVVNHEPGHSYISPEGNNHPLLYQLYRSWQQTHPEAGRAYWSARSWTLLIWQPIYLTVFAVQHFQYLPNILALHQRLNDGNVAGFYLVQPSLLTADKEKLIPHGAARLRRFCQQMLEQLSGICAPRPRLAWRLAADTVLSALCLLQQFDQRYSNQQIINDSQRWLTALELENSSALMRVPLANDREKLALERKACCFEYLCSTGRLCPTCPKQSLHERRQRIAEEFIQHA